MIETKSMEAKMDSTKVFQTGRSQVVRLPKAFRFNSNKVAIENPWDIMIEAVNEFETGFQLERVDQGEQVREDFK